MDELHAAQIALVRAALAGLLASVRAECGADMVRVVFDAEGGLEVEYLRNGVSVAGEGV